MLRIYSVDGIFTDVFKSFTSEFSWTSLFILLTGIVLGFIISVCLYLVIFLASLKKTKDTEIKELSYENEVLLKEKLSEIKKDFITDTEGLSMKEKTDMFGTALYNVANTVASNYYPNSKYPLYELSIEELIHRSKKIAFEEFGVETRLWKKGESVPVVGPWNQDEQPAEEEKNVKGAFADIDFLPIYVYENVLKDSIAFNDFDVKELIAKLYPKLSESGIASQNFVMLHLKTRHDILANEYNRFVDFDIKGIRRKILNLYFRVLKIINSIELACPDLSKYPQQPLVIISQIYEHLLQTLELIESNPKLITDSINDIESSVEGMEYNLDCSYQELKRVIDKETKKGFVLIKHKGLK